MDSIRSLLRRASRRVKANIFLFTLSRAMLGGAAVALLLVLADHIPDEPFVPWRSVLPALAALVGLVTLVRWLQCQPGLMHIAIAVDERLDLRERLSTALQCGTRDDVFAQAAVNDAARAAADPNAGERVRRAFAIRLPRLWWAGPLLACLAGAAVTLPQLGWIALAQSEEELVAAADLDETAERKLEPIVEDLTFRPSEPRADLIQPKDPQGRKPRSGSGAPIGLTGADPTSPDARPGSGRQAGIDAKGGPGGAEGETGDAPADAEAAADVDFGPEDMAPPQPDVAMPPEDEDEPDPEPSRRGGDDSDESGGAVATATQPTATLAQRIRVPSEDSPGATIIAQQWVNLALMRGDWNDVIRRTDAMLVEKLEEGFDEQHVPVKYRDAQKHYFGELKALIESSRRDAKASSASDNASEQ
ncbi:MAG: hypothetical protein JSV91_13745 [Phycisphaerales bacterium]|nr:MAG: hypothetical protein JSV91_13745 [Phycisphaerales bacterium]